MVLWSRKVLTSLRSLFLPNWCQGCMKVVTVYADSIAVSNENKFRRHYINDYLETGSCDSLVASSCGFSAPGPGSGAITRKAPGRTLIQAVPFPSIMPSAATSSFGDVFTFILRAW